jgi:hypothetical protein
VLCGKKTPLEEEFLAVALNTCGETVTDDGRNKEQEDMARPRMPPEDCKSVRVFVRLSPRQLQEINRRKDAAGLRKTGLSTYVRDLTMRTTTGSAENGTH